MDDATSSASGLSTAPYNQLIAANTAPAQNPLVTASQALAMQGQQIRNQRQQIGLDDATLANAANHTACSINSLSPALAMGDNMSMSDLASLAANAIADFKCSHSPEEMAHFPSGLQSNPQTDPATGKTTDPTLAQSLRAYNLQLLSMADRIATMRGQTTLTQQPDGVTVGNVDGQTLSFCVTL